MPGAKKLAGCLAPPGNWLAGAERVDLQRANRYNVLLCKYVNSLAKANNMAAMSVFLSAILKKSGSQTCRQRLLC
jgi:hypothetical protein